MHMKKSDPQAMVMEVRVLSPKVSVFSLMTFDKKRKEIVEW